MHFGVDMYFRQFWRDDRLTFKEPSNPAKILMDRSALDKMWSPDLFIVNSVEGDPLGEKPPGNFFLRVRPSGDILYSQRIQTTVKCPVYLRYYPVDEQICYVEIESFAGTMEDMILGWKQRAESVQISSDAFLPEYRVGEVRLKTIEASLSTGNYSRLAFEISLRRSGGTVIKNTLIPLTTTMICSWYAFWLDVKKQQGARLLILTITSLCWAGLWKISMVKTTYFTSMDVMFMECGIFLLFNLIGFLILQCFNSSSDNQEGKLQKLRSKGSELIERFKVNLVFRWIYLLALVIHICVMFGRIA